MTGVATSGGVSIALILTTLAARLEKAGASNAAGTGDYVDLPDYGISMFISDGRMGGVWMSWMWLKIMVALGVVVGILIGWASCSLLACGRRALGLDRQDSEQLRQQRRRPRHQQERQPQ